MSDEETPDPGVAALARDFVEWGLEYGPQRTRSSKLSAELRRATELMLQAEHLEESLSAERKPAVALFGESQVGKSTFVSELVDTSGSVAALYWDAGKPFRFADINPSAGKEASANVMRFHLGDEPAVKSHPFKLLPLSRHDLLMALARGFADEAEAVYPGLPDLVHDREEFDEALQQHTLKELPELSVDGLRVAHDLASVFRHLGSVVRHHAFSPLHQGEAIEGRANRLWLAALRPEGELPRELLERVFWPSLPGLTRVFLDVLRQTERIERCGEVWLDHHAAAWLLDVDSPAYAEGDGKVCGVRLDELRLWEENGVTLMGVDESGRGEPVARNPGAWAAFQAATGELVAHVNPAYAPKSVTRFLEAVDLLDFPGARPPGISAAADDTPADGLAGERRKYQDYGLILKRGKAASLFELHAARRTMTSVILLQRARANANAVKQVDRSLRLWGQAWHGAEAWPPANADEASVGLFVGLTFADHVLDALGKDNLRLASCAGFLECQYEWFSRGGWRGADFEEVHWLRYPNVVEVNWRKADTDEDEILDRASSLPEFSERLGEELLRERFAALLDEEDLGIATLLQAVVAHAESTSSLRELIEDRLDECRDGLLHVASGLVSLDEKASEADQREEFGKRLSEAMQERLEAGLGLVQAEDAAAHVLQATVFPEDAVCRIPNNAEVRSFDFRAWVESCVSEWRNRDEHEAQLGLSADQWRQIREHLADRLLQEQVADGLATWARGEFGGLRDVVMEFVRSYAALRFSRLLLPSTGGARTHVESAVALAKLDEEETELRSPVSMLLERFVEDMPATMRQTAGDHASLVQPGDAELKALFSAEVAS